MNKINDGGPAFPRGSWDMGMTLRDYFAAKAMQGFIAQELASQPYDWADEVARASYAMADAMLAARDKS